MENKILIVCAILFLSLVAIVVGVDLYENTALATPEQISEIEDLQHYGPVQHDVETALSDGRITIREYTHIKFRLKSSRKRK